MSPEESGPRRLYYSARKHGLGGPQSLSIEQLRDLFVNEYAMLSREHYFQEAFGYKCVDAGVVSGKIADPAIYFFKKLRKKELWPVGMGLNTEEDLFDVMELLHDLVSKGLEGSYHAYADCGMHYRTFDSTAGQVEYRTRMNEFLRDYGDGWELSTEGYVLALGPEGLTDLLEAEPPFPKVENVGDKVRSAITRFRRHGTSAEDKKVAVQDLVDALEYLRPKAKAVLTSKDEGELFELANRFGIRHNRPGQKTDYDPDIWTDWMFYYYLAALRACERLLTREPPPSLDV